MSEAARTLAEPDVARLANLIDDVTVMAIVARLDEDRAWVPYRSQPEEFGPSLASWFRANRFLTDKQVAAARAVLLPRNWVKIKDYIVRDLVVVDDATIQRCRSLAVQPASYSRRGSARRQQPTRGDIASETSRRAMGQETIAPVVSNTLARTDTTHAPPPPPSRSAPPATDAQVRAQAGAQRGAVEAVQGINAERTAVPERRPEQGWERWMRSEPEVVSERERAIAARRLAAAAASLAHGGPPLRAAAAATQALDGGGRIGKLDLDDAPARPAVVVEEGAGRIGKLELD